MKAAEAREAAARVMARCDALAGISETPGSLTRVYLSPEHLRANALVGEWMAAAGMKVWQDSVGNICGRYEGRQSGATALLLGSHLDTVRNAGRYDGMLGVLTAIETVQALHQRGERLPMAIEIIGFGDEEGTRFGITLLGSRGITGSWPESWLSHPDGNSITVAQAMVDVGLSGEAVHQAARRVEEIAAYLELHIEQGPCLEQEGLALGVVTAINGARRLNCCFTGEAGHAGTVPMAQRKDALAAAAEWMVFTEQATPKHHSQLVATVGTLACSPGAVNVIPGEVTLSLDVRGPEDRALAELLSELLTQAEAIALRRGLCFTADEYYQIPATGCDITLQQALSRAVTEVQGRSLSLPSGAGHDAIAIAERWPVGMLFVRCAGGISHHPAESVMEKDVALAIQAYLKVVCEVAGADHFPQEKPLNVHVSATLTAFNQAEVEDARHQIAHCVALSDWRNAVVAGRPYATLESLLLTADELARTWDGEALRQALSAHPRIGEKPPGAGKEADLSRREQSSVSEADSALNQALRAGNLAYEQRFGQVFLIRASGRSGEEILDALERRLANDAQQEQREALNQLREITLLRLKETFQ